MSVLVMMAAVGIAILFVAGLAAGIVLLVLHVSKSSMTRRERESGAERERE